MCERVPFQVDHLAYMFALNPELREWVRTGHAQKMAEDGRSQTIMVHGIPMVSGGVCELWPNRGHLWTAFNTDARLCMVSVIREIRRFLLDSNYDRLEMDTPYGHELAIKRARLLGFELVTERARKFYPDGSDATLFVWVRD